MLFFLSVIFAGITSLINMFEAVSESLADPLWAWPAVGGGPVRRRGPGAWASVLEPEARVGAWMDFVTILVVPFGAVLGAVSVYYVLGWGPIKKEMDLGRSKPLSPAFGALAKYLYVPLSALVFVLGILCGGIG